MKKQFNLAKILTLLILVLSLVSCENIFNFLAPATTSDFSFVLNADSTGYILKKYNDKREESIVTIPSEHLGLPVTEISSGAFVVYSDSLTTISIPDSIALIHDGAFDYCGALTSFVVDENNQHYTAIDGNLYTKDKKTLVKYAQGKTESTFSVPDGVTTIGYGGFENSDELINVVIPNSVITICEKAFSKCDSLENIEISSSSSLKEICKEAFFYCNKLTNISIPHSVEKIGEDAFHSCELLSFNEYNNALYLGNESNPYLVLIKYKDTNITSCKVKDSTKVIGDLAFWKCSSLTDLDISDSVTHIGERALGGSGIYNITIPKSVVKIYNEALSGLYITSFEVDENNEIYCSIDGNIYTKDGKVLVQYATGKDYADFVIPNGVTTIAYGACNNAKFISLSFPSTLVAIEDYAFANSHIKSDVVLPDSLTSIGEFAFSNTELQTVVISGSVTSIGRCAFFQSFVKEVVILPSSSDVIISELAFGSCKNLTKVTIPTSVVSMGEEAFLKCDSAMIYCEASSMPEGWNKNWVSIKATVIWGSTGE